MRAFHITPYTPTSLFFHKNDGHQFRKNSYFIHFPLTAKRIIIINTQKHKIIIQMSTN